MENARAEIRAERDRAARELRGWEVGTPAVQAAERTCRAAGRRPSAAAGRFYIEELTEEQVGARVAWSG